MRWVVYSHSSVFLVYTTWFVGGVYQLACAMGIHHMVFRKIVGGVYICPVFCVYTTGFVGGVYT